MPESSTNKAHEKKKEGNWARFSPLAARLILGGVFIFASIDKIIHPAAFAETVYNYQILPDTLITLTAMILPWLELILGIFLVLGLWLPGAALLINLLMVTFFGSLVFNLSRGLDIHCGCFSTSQESTSLCMCLYVIRDGMFLLLGLYLFSYVLFRKN
ncbi:MAG: DoxX family membrane protein [Desulfobacterales bacterium]|nr:DoxX family membrane protein [Desulfobacterales bacterium]